jgi:hypothetical protein
MFSDLKYVHVLWEKMLIWMNVVAVCRFHKFLLWLGIPLHRVADTKPNEFCRNLSEFSLEYRTTRERVLQQLEKKANHRERNKTRGKMITEVYCYELNWTPEIDFLNLLVVKIV